MGEIFSVEVHLYITKKKQYKKKSKGKENVR